MSSIDGLASYRRGVERIRATWPAFLDKRLARLEQQRRHGVAAERVAENILEDLFTQVLDWTLADLNNQVGYADLLLSRLGIKYLLIEAKRPGALAWNRRAVEQALDQAGRYAAEQKVGSIAVSDGVMLYAADIQNGGLRDRVFVSLDSADAPETLWWLSLHGIYRPREDNEGAALDLLPRQEESPRADTVAPVTVDVLLHPKYKVPARCFAYVGDASNPTTWKLPYRLADGDTDVKRLPKAIQAILSNYRGAKVSTVPESDIPDVLVRLGHAALSLGRMPHQSGNAAAVYVQLEEVLRQLGRLEEVLGDSGSRE
ncbi:MAG: hypothetical protein WCC36_12475 [Gammaproteobacteria bacterium]